jgi:uncharacterized protein YqeY
MGLLEEVNSAIAAAMKARDQLTLDTLRMLKTALTMKEVEKGRAPDATESRQVVNMLVKQRRDSIEQFTKGGRPELAEKEAAEIRVLEHYLPPAVPIEEIQSAVELAVTETGASTAKDVGKVMKATMAKLAGRSVDGKQVNELVRKRLGA